VRDELGHRDRAPAFVWLTADPALAPDVVQNQFAKFGRPFSLTEQVSLREIQSNTIFDLDPSPPPSVLWESSKALLPEGEGSLGDT
jgi:hypothetical protein